MNGHGKLTWRNGAVYEGNFVANKRSGHGTMSFERNNPRGQVTYSGTWVNDLFDGQGELKWKNGDKFNGQFKKGIISGRGTFVWSDGRKYIGQMFNRKAHGSGTMTYAPNDAKFRVSYKGQWRNDNWNGNGFLVLSFGDKYSGSFRDNFFEGNGTYSFADGNKYTGQWKEGKSNGFGILFFSPNNGNNFSRFEGEWKNNKKNGFGKLTWTSGDRYEGNFIEDVAEGSGTFFWSDGRKYEGSFFNNTNEGQGTFYFATKDPFERLKYIGQWKRNPNHKESTFGSGIMHGFGRFYWTDGTFYVGEFRDHAPNGYGTTYDADGKILQEGQWKNGVFKG